MAEAPRSAAQPTLSDILKKQSPYGMPWEYPEWSARHGEMRNKPASDRPRDYLSPVAETISPTMGGYGVGNLVGTLAQALKESRYADAIEPSAMLMATFAGPGAKTANKAALSKAESMAASGASRDAIWAETGWFKGVDGKWRFEIDDGQFTQPQQERFALEQQPIQGSAAFVYRNPDLFRAYPDLARVQTRIDPYQPQTWSEDRWTGYMDRDGNIAGRADTLFNARQLMGHELAHGAQRQEMFARGGSPREFTAEELAAERARLQSRQDNAPPSDWSSIDVSPAVSDMSDLDIGRSLYRRLAGEVEARTVQKRMDMTPEERKARPPWEDYDVPEDQQIVRFAR